MKTDTAATTDLGDEIRRRISKLCAFKRTTNLWADFKEHPYEYRCESCRGSSKIKEKAYHEDHCISKALNLKTTDKLAVYVIRKGYVLDYDGGGQSSCSLCGGPTSFQGDHPKHLRNCPYPLAWKILGNERGEEAAKHFI